MGRLRNMLAFSPGSTLTANSDVAVTPPVDHITAEGIDTATETDTEVPGLLSPEWRTNAEGDADADDADGEDDPSFDGLSADGLLAGLSDALAKIERSVIGEDRAEEWAALETLAERRTALFERVDALLGELDGEPARTGADVAGGDPSPEGNALPHVPPVTGNAPAAPADVPQLVALADGGDGVEWDAPRPEDTLADAPTTTEAFTGNCGCGCSCDPDATSRDPAAEEREERNDRATSRGVRVGPNYAGLVSERSGADAVVPRHNEKPQLVLLADDDEGADE